MRNQDVEVAWPSADQLGEGPVWDDRRRLLYRVDPVAFFFVDSLERRVDRFGYEPAAGDLAGRPWPAWS